MIAIALACEPKVLIADEPTTALDVTIQAQILALLDDLRDRLGMATLLITHDMGVVAGRTDRINVMYAGRIVESAPTERLFTAMRHPYTQSLLGSIPRLDQDATKPLVSIPGLPPDLTNPPTGCRFAPRCAEGNEQCRAQEPPCRAMTPTTCSPAGTRSTGRSPHLADERGRLSAPPTLDLRTPKPLLQIENAVREYPVTAGVLKRKVAPSRPSQT